MNETIPFKKSITFKTKIEEITDISLEHDYKIMDDIIDGDFILEGTYKMTKASVITEDFFYKIPFQIAINDRLLKESICLNIQDFSYEIERNENLNLDIKLTLTAEENLDNFIEEVILEEPEEIEEEKENDRTEMIKDEKQKTIEKNEEYVSYKIYIAKENDNLKAISEKYNVDEEILKKYNNEEINPHDKIIIPYMFDD